MKFTMEELTAAAPELFKKWFAVASSEMSIDPLLKELIQTRVSQINGCANCLNMHVQWAREHGETEQRLAVLAAWDEAPCFTDRERAALGWAEALARQSQSHDLAKVRETLQAHFNAQEQVELTMIINVINGWNRLCVGFELFVDPKLAKATRDSMAA